MTKFVSKDLIKTSVFRTSNHNQGLILHGITFDSKNFVGGIGDGALITFDNNGYDNPYLEMIDCSIKYYKSSMCGAIYFFGTMKNPKIKIERVEVLQDDRFGVISEMWISVMQPTCCMASGGCQQVFVELQV